MVFTRVYLERESGRSQVTGSIPPNLEDAKGDILKRFCGDIAQLGERRLCKAEVTGSIPVISRI